MTEKNQTKVIVVRETVKESVISDTYTFRLAIAVMIPGYLLGIEALQWLGAIMFMITMLAMGVNSKTKMTISEAREFLDKLEQDEK